MCELHDKGLLSGAGLRGYTKGVKSMKMETYVSKTNYYLKCGLEIQITNRQNLEVRRYPNYLKMPKMDMYDFLTARAMSNMSR